MLSQRCEPGARALSVSLCKGSTARASGAPLPVLPRAGHRPPPAPRRRISATSVAQRVAAERAEALGVTVGYQIRMEAVRSEKTRLLFWCGLQPRRSPATRGLDRSRERHLLGTMLTSELCMVAALP
jgi:hypothetical protein